MNEQQFNPVQENQNEIPSDQTVADPHATSAESFEVESDEELAINDDTMENDEDFDDELTENEEEAIRSLVDEFFDEDDLGEVMSEFDVLTLEDAAAYLKVEYGQIRRLIKEQGLPGRKIGEEWRFLRGAIADWLRNPGVGQPPKAEERSREQPHERAIGLTRTVHGKSHNTQN